MDRSPTRGSLGWALLGAYLTSWGSCMAWSQDRPYDLTVSLWLVAAGVAFIRLAIPSLWGRRLDPTLATLALLAWVVVAALLGSSAGTYGGRVPLAEGALTAFMQNHEYYHGQTDAGVSVSGGTLPFHLQALGANLALPLWLTTATASLWLIGGLPATVWARVRWSVAVLTGVAASMLLTFVSLCAYVVMHEETTLAKHDGFAWLGDLRIAGVVGLFCLLLPVLIGRGLKIQPGTPGGAGTRKLRTLAAGMLLGAALLVASYGSDVLTESVGPGGPVRVLIDDAHSSSWEEADRTLDATYFGDMAGYSYGGIAQWLAYDHHVEINVTDQLTTDRLAETDLLILKTPSEAYTEQEQAAIHCSVPDWC